MLQCVTRVCRLHVRVAFVFFVCLLVRVCLIDILVVYAIRFVDCTVAFHFAILCIACVLCVCAFGSIVLHV